FGEVSRASQSAGPGDDAGGGTDSSVAGANADSAIGIQRKSGRHTERSPVDGDSAAGSAEVAGGADGERGGADGRAAVIGVGGAGGVVVANEQRRTAGLDRQRRRSL